MINVVQVESVDKFGIQVRDGVVKVSFELPVARLEADEIGFIARIAGHGAAGVAIRSNQSEMEMDGVASVVMEEGANLPVPA